MRTLDKSSKSFNHANPDSDSCTPKLRFKGFDDKWENRNIGSVLTIGSGKDYKHLSNGDIPVFGTGGLMAWVDSYLHDGETVCIGRKGTIDKPMFYSGKLWTVDTLFFTHSFKSTSPKFIYNLFQKINWKEYNEASGVPSLSKTTIEKIKLHLPSLPEQQKIAAFLSAVDEKIQQLTRKKEALERYKKGVMQQLFSGKLRFKDENGKVFPKWEEKRIDDLFEVTRGNVLAVPMMSKIKTESTPYPVYSSQTKENGLVGFYSKFLFENSLTWTTDGANAGEVNFREGQFYCTNVCGVLISKKGLANKCVAEILNRVSRKYVSYVGNPKLMNNVMATIKIHLPSSINEQIRISEFITGIDTKIERVSSQITEAQTFKKGLLQQLFV